MAPGRSAGAAPPRAEEQLASVEEVTASIAAAIAVVPAAEVPLAQAAGRVLAEPVRAPFPLPRFDNAAMDGYAVRASDVAAANPATPPRCAWSGPRRRAWPRWAGRRCGCDDHPGSPSC